MGIEGLSCMMVVSICQVYKLKDILEGSRHKDIC